MSVDQLDADELDPEAIIRTPAISAVTVAIVRELADVLSETTRYSVLVSELRAIVQAWDEAVATETIRPIA